MQASILEIQQLPNELVAEINNAWPDASISLDGNITEKTKTFRSNFSQVLQETDTPQLMVDHVTLEEKELTGKFKLVREYMIRYDVVSNNVSQIISHEYWLKQ